MTSSGAKSLTRSEPNMHIESLGGGFRHIRPDFAQSFRKSILAVMA